MFSAHSLLCELPYRRCDTCRRIPVLTDRARDTVHSCIANTQASRNVGGGVHLQDDSRITWHLIRDVNNTELTIKEVHSRQDTETQGVTYELAGDVLSSVGCSQTSNSVHLYLLNARGILHVIAIPTKPSPTYLSSIDAANVHMFDISEHLTGKAAAIRVCGSHLCLALSDPDAILTIPTAEFTLRPAPKFSAFHPLHEPSTIRSWVAGLFGAPPALRIAALDTFTLDGTAVLAALYTNGALSLWEPSARRHLGQASLTGAAATAGGLTGASTAQGMCVCSVPCTDRALIVAAIDSQTGVTSSSRTLTALEARIVRTGYAPSAKLTPLGDIDAARVRHAARDTDCSAHLADQPDDTLSSAVAAYGAGGVSGAGGRGCAPEELGDLLGCVGVAASASQPAGVVLVMTAGVWSRLVVLSAASGCTPAVEGCVHTLEAQLQEQLLTDLSSAAEHAQLLASSRHLAGTSAGQRTAAATVTTEDEAAISAIYLRTLLAPAALDLACVREAAKHVGGTVPALHRAPRADIGACLVAVMATAARTQPGGLLGAWATFAQRYVYLVASRQQVVGVLAALPPQRSGGGGSGSAAAVVHAAAGLVRRGARPTLLRRGTAHEAALHGLLAAREVCHVASGAVQRALRAALALAGALLEHAPLQALLDGQGLGVAPLAEALVLGVTGGPFPMPASAHDAQAAWRLQRRRLVLDIQQTADQVDTLALLTALQAVLAGEAGTDTGQLAERMQDGDAASTSDTVSASLVEAHLVATAEGQARFSFAVLLLLELIQATGRVGRSQITPQVSAAIQELRLHAQRRHAAALTILWLATTPTAHSAAPVIPVASLDLAHDAAMDTAPNGDLPMHLLHIQSAANPPRSPSSAPQHSLLQMFFAGGCVPVSQGESHGSDAAWCSSTAERVAAAAHLLRGRLAGVGSQAAADGPMLTLIIAGEFTHLETLSRLLAAQSPPSPHPDPALQFLEGLGRLVRIPRPPEAVPAPTEVNRDSSVSNTPRDTLGSNSDDSTSTGAGEAAALAAAVPALCAAADAVGAAEAMGGVMEGTPECDLCDLVDALDAWLVSGEAVASDLPFEVRYFEMLMRLVADKLHSPAGAAVMAAIALRRLQVPLQPACSEAAGLDAAAATARLCTCRFNYLCSAGDWAAAYAAAVDDPDAARSLRHVRIIVQRVVLAGRLDVLLSWDFPGGRSVHHAAGGPLAAPWVQTQPYLQVALQELDVCAQRGAPCDRLYHAIYALHSAGGRQRDAATAMVRFAGHLHREVALLPHATDSELVAMLLRAVSAAAAALALLPPAEAWLHGDLTPAPPPPAPAGVVTLQQVRGEAARLRGCALLAALPPTPDGSSAAAASPPQPLTLAAAGGARPLLAAPAATVVDQLVRAQLFVDAATLSRATAPTPAAHMRHLASAVSRIAELCVSAQRGAPEHPTPLGAFQRYGSEASWAQLRHAIDLFEGSAWWRAGEWPQLDIAQPLPAGCLRVAAAKAMLAMAPNMKVPAYLLACASPAADSAAAAAGSCASSTAASAEILKALLAAGQLKQASGLIEEQLDRWALQLPTDRQLNSSFWLPYAVVQQVVDALRACDMQDVLSGLQSRLTQHVQASQRDTETLRAGQCLLPV